MFLEIRLGSELAPIVGVEPCRPSRLSPLFYGERGRNRTFNLLIKSQLLCQLSYAPGSGIKIFRMPSRG